MFAYLVLSSKFLPRTSGVLLAIDGLAYLWYSFTDILAPDAAAHLVPWIQLPALIGEGSRCLWLRMVGITLERWNQQTSAAPSCSSPNLSGGKSGMEEERARALLRAERQRLERLLGSVDADHDRVTRADEVAGDLADGADRRIGEETDEAVARQLHQRMEALQRAEGRLAAGTYGRSVLSGRPIPDERLEAFPLAELTTDEEAAREHLERPFAEAVERAADGEDRAGRDPAVLDAARLGPSREPFQVLQDPAVQDNPLVEDDETTFDEPPPELDPAMPDGIAEDDTGRIQPLP